jgi:hypothetical protein
MLAIVGRRVDQEGSDCAGDPISSAGPSARLITLKLRTPIEWVESPQL